jgi:hypothetical protein
MNITDILIIGLGIFLYFAYSTARRHDSSLRKGLEAVEVKLEAIEEHLGRVDGQLSEIGFNTLSPAGKDDWAFDHSPDLILADLRAAENGQTWWLIAKSWYYPSEMPLVEIFQYKHDHVDDKTSSKFGYEVHGFHRSTERNDWEPYRFLASEKESKTWSCGGTVRRLSDYRLAHPRESDYTTRGAV